LKLGFTSVLVNGETRQQFEETKPCQLLAKPRLWHC